MLNRSWARIFAADKCCSQSKNYQSPGEQIAWCVYLKESKCVGCELPEYRQAFDNASITVNRVLNLGLVRAPVGMWCRVYDDYSF